MIELIGKYTNALLTLDNFELELIGQITKAINKEAFVNPIVIMPDGHCGAGVSIGFTMKLDNKIIPQIIGVDINCGMQAVRLSERLDRNKFSGFDKQIRELVPMGMNVNKRPIFNFEREFDWEALNRKLYSLKPLFDKIFNIDSKLPHYSYEWFKNKCKELDIDQWYCQCSIGSLGGGKVGCLRAT